MALILLVDDDADFREGLAEALTDFGGTVLQAATGDEALAVLSGHVVAGVILDYDLAGETGLEVLERIRAQSWSADSPVVMLTAYPTIDNTIEATRLGVIDHVAKPLSRAGVERLAALFGDLKADRRAAITPPQPPRSGRGALIGSSAVMHEVHKLVGRLAGGDQTALILGETGTGKEVVARTIHGYSARAGAPFVPVNAASIPPDLLEGELFGHLKGSFPGALASRRGAIREAQGGTLFLDEVGDMDLAAQAKLLRFLEDRTVTPIGADRAVAVDVRILAATHRDLAARIREGRFREDLFFRLKVVTVSLPPLRDRGDDVQELAERFLLTDAEPGRYFLTPRAKEALRRHGWPGNVRELRNAIERARAMAAGGRIDVEGLALESRIGSRMVDGIDDTDINLGRAVGALEARLIEIALTRAGGNKARAAAMLGINRQLLYSKLERLQSQESG